MTNYRGRSRKLEPSKETIEVSSIFSIKERQDQRKLFSRRSLFLSKEDQISPFILKSRRELTHTTCSVKESPSNRESTWYKLLLFKLESDARGDASRREEEHDLFISFILKSFPANVFSTSVSKEEVTSLSLEKIPWFVTKTGNCYSFEERVSSSFVFGFEILFPMEFDSKEKRFTFDVSFWYWISCRVHNESLDIKSVVSSDLFASVIQLIAPRKHETSFNSKCSRRRRREKSVQIHHLSSSNLLWTNLMIEVYKRKYLSEAEKGKTSQTTIISFSATIPLTIKEILLFCSQLNPEPTVYTNKSLVEKKSWQLLFGLSKICRHHAILLQYIVSLRLLFLAKKSMKSSRKPMKFHVSWNFLQ